MKRLFRVWFRRVAIFAGLLVLIGLMIDFNARLVRLTHLRAQRDIEKERLIEVENTKDALLVEIAFASSEAALEEWAREEGRLTKPDDIAVIPLPVEVPTPIPEIIEQTYIEPESNWDAWMEWLSFGHD